MPQPVYPWKRFWYPRETAIELLDGGYLDKPERAQVIQGLSDNLISLSELDTIPCLILLGEPGLGKSRELSQQYTFTRDHLNEAALWCDFGAYQEQSMLLRALFDDATFQAWLRGTGRLYLFLDSLDEGLLSIPRSRTSFQSNLHAIAITCCSFPYASPAGQQSGQPPWKINCGNSGARQM